jgi:hypothetical protein
MTRIISLTMLMLTAFSIQAQVTRKGEDTKKTEVAGITIQTLDYSGYVGVVISFQNAKYSSIVDLHSISFITKEKLDEFTSSLLEMWLEPAESELSLSAGKWYISNMPDAVLLADETLDHYTFVKKDNVDSILLELNRFKEFIKSE